MKKLNFGWARAIVIAILAVLPFGLMYTPVGALGSDVFEQCETGNPPTGTCNWIGSILNPIANTYFEGMATAQRVLYRDIDTTVTTRTIQFQFQWTKGGKHAYDFPVTWAQAETLAQSIGHYTLKMGPQCASMPGSAANQTACNSVTLTQTIPFSGDPYVSGSFALPAPNGNTNEKVAAFAATYGTPGVQLVTTAGVTATFRTPLHDVADGADSGDSLVTYTLDVTRTGPSFPATILLLFAAHIAISDAPGDPSAPGTTWGQGSGAKNISGAPYHVKDPCILPGGSCPNEDNQLNLNGTPLTPALVTQISSAARAFGQPVSDTVTMTLSASTVLSGQLKFYICGPAAVPNPCLPQYVTKTLVSTIDVSETATSIVRSSANINAAAGGVSCFLVQWINQDFNSQSWQSFATGNECVTVTSSTAVRLSSMRASHGDAASVRLNWVTGSEINTAGFNLYRAESKDGPYARINAQLIAATNTVTGYAYEYEDATALPGKTYYYQLEDVELNGKSTRHDPVALNAPAVDAMKRNAPMAIGIGLAAFAAIAGGLIVTFKKLDWF